MEQHLMKVSETSKLFGVSTRMIRYYEQNGLIESRRVPGYAYRVYDEEALARLRQIVLLRKLRIPIKDVRTVLENADAVAAIEVFERKIEELGGEIEALATIQRLIVRLVEELEARTDIAVHPLLEVGDGVLASIDALNLAGNSLEQAARIEALEKADTALTKPTDIRIITLPPSFVASAHCVGDDPESHARDMMDTFVKANELWDRKPDMRSFGFNHPNPKDESGFHGYEIQVTIPDDMDVPFPLEKKRFEGGLYAAHMISFGNFNEWDGMFAWLNESPRYEFAGDFSDQEHMCGLLDEHLNYVSHAQLKNTEPEDTQFDLLMPIALKTSDSEQ